MGIRLLLADDHEVVRTGLAKLLADTDIEIVAEATGGDEAVELAMQHRPDVVLLDIRMADGDGLNALEAIHGNGKPGLRETQFSLDDLRGDFEKHCAKEEGWIKFVLRPILPIIYGAVFAGLYVGLG